MADHLFALATDGFDITAKAFDGVAAGCAKGECSKCCGKNDLADHGGSFLRQH